MVNDFHLKYVIDFRNSGEAAEFDSLEGIPGIQYIHLPLNPEPDSKKQNTVKESMVKTVNDKAGNPWVDLFYKLGGTVEAAISYMIDGYLIVLTEEAYIEQVREFFYYLLENENGGILFHCSAGKDRTGIISAILLSVLGVSWDKVMEDYLLTNVFLSNYISQQIEKAMSETGSSQVAEGVKIFISADHRMMDGVLQTVVKYYGSMDNYISKALRLTPEKISRLREIYTETM